jgi:hypothetical protein
MTISAEDIKRRDKLLGMLSSDYDGERATASAMLARMAAHYKMTIPELCQAGTASQPKQQAKPRPQPTSDDNEMLLMLRKVIDHHLDLVTTWEEEFLENVTDKYYRDDDLSEKQKAVAMRILQKVALNAGRGDGFRRV